MQLITSSAKLSSAFRKQLDMCTTLHLAVAWASVGFPECDALIKARRKIGLAVFGTHFYQTAPEFIEKFCGDERVRFVMDHSGVFHPKLYLFECKEGRWACIVGSANFTGGGFGGNQEACLLVTEADDPEGTILANARKSIEGHWNNAVLAADVDLDGYREMRKRLVRPLAHAAGHFGGGKQGHAVENVSILNLDWDDFLSQVRNDKHHALGKRLDVLDAAQSLFRKHKSFSVMPLKDRQGIAGFRESGDVPWGWFGGMRGAGVFKNIVNESPEHLSDALDQVPLNGRVSRDDYLAFVSRFVRAFPLKDGKPTRHGLATATRLLTMKRTDCFVCLDGANRRLLLNDFGINVPIHDYEGYWDKIIERIKLATWWNARRPIEAISGRVWDGRTAMLDAIYYTPDL